MCRALGILYQMLKLSILSFTYHIKGPTLCVKEMQTKLKSDHGKMVKIEI